MFSHETVTVGWICALSTEFVAACAILDEELPQVKAVTRNDNNNYALGKIGPHLVAVAALPEEEYGMSSAASVARDMVHTFPNIRFGLMVGIGGGAPTAKHDIRLGDVVVSQPREGHGGVFQYDFGKTIQEKSFQQTRFLNQPPGVLRTAISRLKVAHEMEGHQIKRTLERVLEAKPRLRKKYSRPPKETDRLYKSSILHPDTIEGDCVKICSDTSEDLVVREDRDPDIDDPEIHYGLIASGNSLIKNATMRDHLAQERDVLCFEMEAAGLMNHFPCLVVRGICDYADTHKNKVWQGYAAMTSAAYAKELLLRIAPERLQEVESLSELVEGVRDLNDGIRGISQNQQQVFDHATSTDNRNILEALKKCNYEEFKDRNPKKAQGTCTWVLEHKRFYGWSNSRRSGLLWISADPGCGKSVLAKAFVDDPNFSPAVQGSRLTCYFFFKDNDEQNTLAVALCTLLHQLFSQCPKLLDFAKAAWNKHGSTLCKDADELWRVFCNVVSASDTGHVLCVLDALDECKDEDRSRLLIRLKKLHFDSMGNMEKLRSTLKIVATSRPYPDLERILDPIPGIRLRGEDKNESLKKEIDMVIVQRINSLAIELNIKERNRNKLEQRLLRMEHRTYLWLNLVMSDIKNAYDSSLGHGEVEIEVLPISIQQAYEKLLQGIASSRNESARRVLGVVVGARRPLSIDELRYALGVAKGGNIHDLDEAAIDIDFDLKDWVRRCCGLFVYFEGQKAFLIHQTAKEFLLAIRQDSIRTWTWSFSHNEIEELMASICIRTLCCNDLKELAPRILERHEYFPFEAQLPQNSKKDKCTFLEYCAGHWLDHSRHIFDVLVNCLRSQIDMLHDVSSEIYAFWSRIYSDSNSHGHMPSWTEYMLCAYTGYTDLLERSLTKQSETPRAKDRHGNNALCLASLRGNHDAVKVLLDKGAEIQDTVSSRNELYVASYLGHVRVVQILLDKGAKIDVAISNEGHYAQRTRWEVLKEGDLDLEDVGSPKNSLEAASFKGHVEIVQILIEKAKLSDPQATWTERALPVASFAGHVEVVKALLAKGVGLGDQSHMFIRALEAASWAGHVEVVHVLLDTRIDLQGDLYGEALRLASRIGNTRIVKKLLAKGADANANSIKKSDSNAQSIKDPDYDMECMMMLSSTLFAALREGHTEVVQLLLENGLDINAWNSLFSRALGIAVASGFTSIVLILLAKGTDVNADKGDYDESLYAASLRGDLELVRRLLDKGANANACFKHELYLHERYFDYHSAIQAASSENYGEVVQTLIDKGADVNTFGGDYGTALCAASACGAIDVVRILIANGADLNVICSEFGTPLMAALTRRHTKIVQELLKAGANLNTAGGKESATHLMAASIRGDIEIVKALLEAGADANVTVGYIFGTPLIAASSNGHVNLAHLLLEWLTDRNIGARHIGCGTALIAAAFNGRMEIAQTLLAKGANVNARSGQPCWGDRGKFCTALHAAADQGHIEIVQLLLAEGADANADNGAYLKPHMCARRNGHADVVQLLFENGAKKFC